MSEIEQLKKRISEANYDGITTAIIKDDYEPIGQMMISQLVESGEFISRRDTAGLLDMPWKVWAKGFEPRF